MSTNSTAANSMYEAEAKEFPGAYCDKPDIVSYCPSLLEEFDCHINVLYCANQKVLKYLYKYIHKGDRSIQANVCVDDDITHFQVSQYIQTMSALWRIFEFPLHGIYPYVHKLPMYTAANAATTNHHELTAWYEYNRLHPGDAVAQRLFYIDFPTNDRTFELDLTSLSICRVPSKPN